MAEPDMNWKNNANELRQAAVQKIEDARRKSGNLMMGTKSGEIEAKIFQQAKAQDEYCQLISNILKHIQQQQQQFSTPESGQAPQQPNTNPTSMRAMAMQQRPGFPNYSNPQQVMMGRPGPQGFPRNEMLMPQQQRQMMIQNQQGFSHMMMNKSPAGMNRMGMGMGVPMGSGQITSPAGGLMPPGSGGGGAMPSPGNMLPNVSPGPSHVIAPSPGNRPQMTGIPSPINININTPGSVNPGSVGPMGQQSKLSNAEEQAYLEKWQQLQKYIDPLKRMINRIDKDEDRKMDLNKMKNLLDILSDSTKRLPLATLQKCEIVLEKQLDYKPTVSGPPTVAPLPGLGSENMCQALLDTIAAHMKSPTLNHTLQRTFGPAVRALHGPPVGVDSPPLKKRRSEDADDGFEIDDLIQGEIARLHHRFIVNLDSRHQSGSKRVQLLCRLEDKNLPYVPPLLVQLPEKYPHGSPICQLNPDEYETSPFLQRLQLNLTYELNRLTLSYSLTALLNIWDQCVRKACEPTSSS